MTTPGISVKLTPHPVAGHEVVMLTVYEADHHDVQLALPHPIAGEFANALKTLLREARQLTVPEDGSTVVGALLLPAGTLLEFTMVPDPCDAQTALDIVVTPPPTAVITSDDGTPSEEAPESFRGILSTPGERSLFIGELSRCARLARLKAEEGA